MKNIAIIPARSGSKGLKDKNIRLLNGKPLFAYSVEAAVKSGMFDEIMVSTDSEKYAELAMEFGAKVPFFRSEETSSDSASSWDAVNEVLSKYEACGRVFDTFCLLQPTSPLRSAEDIRSAYSLFNKQADFAVVSVCEAEHSPLWCGHLSESCELVGFIRDQDTQQRQCYEAFYRINGAIYIVNIAKFQYDTNIYQAGSYAYIMPQYRSVDIDTEMDFFLAECFLAYQRIRGEGQ